MRGEYRSQQHQSNGYRPRRYHEPSPGDAGGSPPRRRRRAEDHEPRSAWRTIGTWGRIAANLLDMVAGDSEPERSSTARGLSRRQRFVKVAFFAGVAIAPIAALLLLLGQGVAPLRAAASLSVLAVVLLGLSITFREDPATIRRELEEEFKREVAVVRADVATLRRGVQLTVNRELDRVRGELEQARSVVRAEATRLPAGGMPVSRHPMRNGQLPTATRMPLAANGGYGANGGHGVNGAHGVNGGYSAGGGYGTNGHEPHDVHTVEPIREQYRARPLGGEVIPPPNRVSGPIPQPPRPSAEPPRRRRRREAEYSYEQDYTDYPSSGRHSEN